MSRLIDADALLENMRTHCEFCKHNDHRHVCREDCVWHEAMDEVEDMPEIEATTITASDNGIAVGAIHGGITINRTYNQKANEVYNIGHLERMDG